MKFLLLIITLVTMGFSHSGRTDSSGGHNCSAKSKSKGLCTGYHYHNGGSSNKSSGNYSSSKSTGNSEVKEMQRLLKNGGYYKGSIDGIIGKGTINAGKVYLSDNSYNNDRLNYLLKAHSIE